LRVLIDLVKMSAPDNVGLPLHLPLSPLMALAAESRLAERHEIN